jgi:DNA polymerase III subunit delta'
MSDDLPEPDRVEGAPHPRETHHLFGQAAAEDSFLSAFNSSRQHHAWLISGPQGVGKATLAWRIARFLLATPVADGGMFDSPAPINLDVAPDHPVSRRMAAMSEGRMFLLRRGLNDKETAFSADIRVDEVRKMKSFFTLSAADGGRRAAIIDAADDLNPPAANALLKLLEEPPVNVTLFLISHRPNSLLATIRSRCRDLRLGPLPPADLAAAVSAAGGNLTSAEASAISELAGGSVGAAFRLTHQDGLAVYAGIVRLFTTLPLLDRQSALALAETAAGRGAETQFELIATLVDLFLARLARAATVGTCPPEAAKGEADLLTRLGTPAGAGLAWADLAQSLTLRARRGRAVNLDPAALLMDMLLKIDETAGTLLAKK